MKIAIKELDWKSQSVISDNENLILQTVTTSENVRVLEILNLLVI